EVEWVAGQMRFEPLENRKHRVRRFAVIARRVGFAPPLHAVAIRQPYPHHAVVLVAPPGDDEGVPRLQGDHVGRERQGHGSNNTRFTTPARARAPARPWRADRADTRPRARRPLAPAPRARATPSSSRPYPRARA